MMGQTDSFGHPQHVLRSAHRPDTIQATQATHDYSGVVTQSNGNRKCINNAVHITTVDDKTRAEALAYFNSCQQSAAEAQHFHQKEHNKGVVATVIGALGIGGVGFAAAFAAPHVAIALGVCSLATTVFGAQTISRHQKIIHHLEQDRSDFQVQRDAWRDPVQRAIEQRQLAGSQGFSYVFNHNLKDTIVHPEEVKALWIRDFSKMLTSPQSVNAFSADLLGIAKLDYAWNRVPLHDLNVNGRNISASLLRGMAARYQECSRDYQLFKTKINEEIRALEHQSNSLKQEIVNQREAWIQPAYHIHNMGMQEAKLLYNQAIDQFVRERELAVAEVEHDCNVALRDCLDANDRAQIQSIRHTTIANIRRDYDHHPAVIAIEEAYKRDRSMCSFLFDQSKMTVNAFFDQRLHQLEMETARARQQIDQQRISGEGYFSHHLNQILQANETSIHSLQFSTPMITRQWILSNFGMQPAWNDVYGRTPRFQHTFATTLTEDAWNLFWGDRGLRRFASSPMHSWKSFSSDRSYFPFQQRGLHLHALRHRPQQRMFCQRVVVPTRTARAVPGTRTTTSSFDSTQQCPVTPPRRETVRPTPVSTPRQETPRATPGTSAGAGATRRREESTPRQREPVKATSSTGFGSTRRREETPLRQEAARATPGASSGNTQRGEGTSPPRREAVRAKPGVGYGGTKRR